MRSVSGVIHGILVLNKTIASERLRPPDPLLHTEDSPFSKSL